MDDFLSPLILDLDRIILLAKKLSVTFKKLAAEADNQFLSTPISESVLIPTGAEEGRYLAIDIGGTNVRAGFVELSGGKVSEPNVLSGNNVTVDASKSYMSRVRRTQKSWPIGEKLKQEKAEDLFEWIGACIAEVVEDALNNSPEPLPAELPIGVTFSFPMIQHSLPHATLMSMGKGFAITSNLDLGNLLLTGYEKASRQRNLPRIKVAAIVNDSVATLISFVYQLERNPRRKAAMGLIVGTGINATIPMKLRSLKASKWPKRNDIASNVEMTGESKIVVNTEWTINGATGPLRELDLFTKWDRILDAECEAPGFQPFEYMTAGRYLGELGRLLIVDYLSTQLGVPTDTLPPGLRLRNGLTTTFLGNLRLDSSPSIVDQLSTELPPAPDGGWQWTAEAAQALYHIAKAIQVRAARMAAAAIIGLLACAEEISFPDAAVPVPNAPIDDGHSNPRDDSIEELVIGYTGGCIDHFQDYLHDCQAYLDEIMDTEFAGRRHPRVVLQPSHDGGIIGAGVLAGTVQGLAEH